MYIEIHVFLKCFISGIKEAEAFLNVLVP